MKNSYVYAVVSIVVVAILGMLIVHAGKGRMGGREHTAVPGMAGAANQPAQQQVPQPAMPGGPAGLTIAGSPVEGSMNAPVTMIECSDFQCPFCARFYQETLVQLRKNEIRNGVVKLVFKNFPLPFHPYAEKAAEAAECANKQGKFWQMHDALFQSGGRLDTDSLKTYAQRIGLDMERFDHCLDSGETAGIVNADRQQCASAGVQGTPTFFINGKMLVGAQPYAQFRRMIEQADH